MSASANALPRAPAVTPVWKEERPELPPSDSCIARFRLPNAPRRNSSHLPETPSSITLNSLKREIAEWPDRTITAQEALFVVSSFFLSPEEAQERASDLLNRFGSLGAIFSAPRELIDEVTQDSDFWITLKSIQSVIMTILREPIEEKPILRDASCLYDYLRISLSHEKREVVRLLFLNSRNALILDEFHSKGTVDHTPVYPREIVRRAIETCANALIIVHNHPSGDPTPSAEDVKMTRHVGRILSDLGVTLHDHVIVGLHRCQSMRALRLI